MNEDNVGKLTGIVPEMWHDLIARIVPGAIIAYFALGSDPKLLTDISFSNFAGALILAYLIGLFADILSGTATNGIAFIGKYIPNGPKTWLASRLPTIFTQSLTISNYNLIDTLKSPARDLMVKFFAEVVLCRSLFYFAAIHWIAALWVASPFTTPKVLAAVFGMIPGWPPITAVFASLAMLVSWCHLNAAAQSRITNLLKLTEKEPEKTP
jgi:hypothetical protein